MTPTHICSHFSNSPLKPRLFVELYDLLVSDTYPASEIQTQPCQAASTARPVPEQRSVK